MSMEMPKMVLKVPTSRLAGARVSSCSNVFALFSSKFSNSQNFNARLVKAPMCQPVQSFAASSSDKIKVQRKKKRLDELMKCVSKDFNNIVEHSYSHGSHRHVALNKLSLSGKVFVDGKVVSKSGTQISDKSQVEIKAEVPKYVCRAGHKLEAAIEQLEIDVTGKVALDSGLSTGGFTDCLLQYGASFVYGVDVGYGQVAEKIRTHDCVSVIERTNLRYLTELPQKVDLVTLDLSFISILTVMPAVISLMKNDAMLVTLIKPQFEARRSQVGGGGIVRDPSVHREVLAKIINGVQYFGFECKGWIDSPLKGADGNKEFLASFTRKPKEDADADPDASAAKADIAGLYRGIEAASNQ